MGELDVVPNTTSPEPSPELRLPTISSRAPFGHREEQSLNSQLLLCSCPPSSWKQLLFHYPHPIPNSFSATSTSQIEPVPFGLVSPNSHLVSKHADICKTQVPLPDLELVNRRRSGGRQQLSHQAADTKYEIIEGFGTESAKTQQVLEQ